jgi:hypothetical protein
MADHDPLNAIRRTTVATSRDTRPVPIERVIAGNLTRHRERQK